MGCDKKILFLVTEDAPGMRAFAYSLIKCVGSKLSHAIIVVKCESDKRHFAGLDSYCNVHYMLRPSGRWAKMMWHFWPRRLLARIERCVCDFDLQLIVTVTGEFCLSWQFSRLQRLRPVLHTVHDAIAHEYKLSFINSLKDKVFVSGPNKMILRKGRDFVSCSMEQVNWLKGQCGDGKNVSYCPFPSLVTPAIESGTEPVGELVETAGYILFFGRVEFYKGVHLLYDVYRRYKSCWEGRKLVIAGRGDYGSYYFRIDQALSHDVIVINRFIEDSEIRFLFENAAIVVYPYISATQTGVLSLAAFFDKRVVVSDVPFFRTTVGDCDGVFVCDVNNEEEFAHAITKAIKSNDGSRQLYEKNYTTEALIRHFSYACNKALE